MKVSVKTVTDRTTGLRQAMAALTQQIVVVGIPAAKGARGGDEDGAVTNSQLGFIHEHGSPARNIPARPFLAPGVRAAQEAIIAQLRGAARRALDGHARAVGVALDRAGIIAQNSVRARFVDNDWEPLSDATLDKRPPSDPGEDGKRKRSRRERGAVNPLIDTAQMRKSVTYEVRKRR